MGFCFAFSIIVYILELTIIKKYIYKLGLQNFNIYNNCIINSKLYYDMSDTR